MAESFSTGLRDAMMVTGCFKDIMDHGILVIFDGTKPTGADTSEGSCNILMKYTKDGATFTSGAGTNGLVFGSSTAGVISKNGDVWSGVGLTAAGLGTTATWWRFYDKDYVTGASTTAKRFDGNIGTSSTYEARMSNTTIVDGGPATVSTFTVTLPMA